MPNVSSTKGAKRKRSGGVPVSEPPSRSSTVTFLSPSLILLEVPADTNTSLPVWDAMRSQRVDVSWTVNPYSVSVHVTPTTSQPEKSETSSQSASTSSVVLQSALQASCVLLTPQSPNTSLILSLPLIITQPQPAAPQHSTPKKQMLPATPTDPPPAPTKLQPSASALALFHTRSSPNIQICDNFLLGLCTAGKKCKKHHTRYPFHWQLWCVTTHEWVDVAARSQVVLERNYCNVHQETAYIRDGPVHYCLSFESMELDNQSKYDRVRRLTNSESPAKNPHFPSKWKIYWWNNHDWEEYNKDVSTLLLQKMSQKEPLCYFFIGSQKYELDFTIMIQTNVDTGFNRMVRCRPVYRSPGSMQPHLQTGVQTEPSEPDADPPASNFSVDPLEEFSSWYPPVWCPVSEQDYSLVDVPVGTQAYKSVQNLFYESLSEIMVDIISIQQVQNLLHWDKYQRHKTHMNKQHTKPKEPLERLLFHGTTKEAAEDICHNNFDPRLAGVNGTSQGFGSYFATSAAFSNTFSSKTKGSPSVRHMFLAKVLVGKVSPGCTHYRRPPPINSKTRKFCLYDTCVDNVEKPTMFVVFDSCQCYPYYLIRYKDLPKVVDI